MGWSGPCKIPATPTKKQKKELLGFLERSVFFFADVVWDHRVWSVWSF